MEEIGLRRLKAWVSFTQHLCGLKEGQDVEIKRYTEVMARAWHGGEIAHCWQSEDWSSSVARVGSLRKRHAARIMETLRDWPLG